MIRCVECSREAEYIVNGDSCCKLHFDLFMENFKEENGEV
jgi:hypothetical protein